MCGGGGRVHAAGVTVAFAAPGKCRWASSPADLDWARCNEREPQEPVRAPDWLWPRLFLLRNIKYNKQHNNHLIINQTNINNNQNNYFIIIYYIYNILLLLLLLLYFIIIFWPLFFIKIKNPFLFRHFVLKINPMEGTDRHSPTLSTEWRTSILLHRTQCPHEATVWYRFIP